MECVCECRCMPDLVCVFMLAWLLCVCVCVWVFSNWLLGRGEEIKCFTETPEIRVSVKLQKTQQRPGS